MHTKNRRPFADHQILDGTRRRLQNATLFRQSSNGFGFDITRVAPSLAYLKPISAARLHRRRTSIESDARADQTQTEASGYALR